MRLYLCIGDELATIVLNNASRSSLLSHVLGQPLNITGFWLLHHFPSRAPPEYDRLWYASINICVDPISDMNQSGDQRYWCIPGDETDV